MKAKKLFFKECHLAGRQYHDADEVWDQLKVGTELRLERDLDNRYDKNAVAVMFDEKDKNGNVRDEFVLGYIPSDENEVIAQFLEMGWNQCFSCRISKIDPSAHYENQIHLTIKINRNEEEDDKLTEPLGNKENVVTGGLMSNDYLVRPDDLDN